jgi:DNA modification methylase
MEVVWHRVQTPVSREYQTDRDGQSRLFVDATMGVSDASRAKRDTMGIRIAKAKEIVDVSPGDHFVLWHDLEAERHAIKRAIPEAVEVYGSQDLDEREQRIIDFSEGRHRILATKPILSGSGCNFQRHCHREVFVGVGFKFNDFIQSIHRVQRFQQTERVRIDIIYADTEDNVVKALKQKWKQHEELVNKMEELIKKYGLADSTIAEALRMNMEVERVEASGNGWLVANNDTVEEAKLLEDDSIDLIVTSIPFSNHYSYCPSYRDMGATDDDDHFFAQMDYLTPNLFRALKPGRIMAVHTKDRIQFGNVTGAGLPTVEPFHMETYEHYHKHGFDYIGMITVVTDVVRENNQTYRLGWTEMCKDGTKMGVGCPEYILLFHKPQTDRSRGYADIPVVHDKDEYSRARWQVDAHAFWRSSGNRPLTSEEIAALPVGELTKAFTQRTMDAIYNYETHVRIGDELEGHGHLPATFMAIAPGSWAPDVWTDVVRMRTLNTSQAQKGREAHVCPLPIDIVDRLIERYSNPGELVYDPFGGLFTVPYEALKLGRRGRAVELNSQYFLDGVSYLKAREQEMSMPTLFDLEGIEV